MPSNNIGNFPLILTKSRSAVPTFFLFLTPMLKNGTILLPSGPPHTAAVKQDDCCSLVRGEQYSKSNDCGQTPNLLAGASLRCPPAMASETGAGRGEQHRAGLPRPLGSQLEGRARPRPPRSRSRRFPQARGAQRQRGGGDRRAAALPARAPPLEQGAGPGRGPLAQAENGAENLSQPSVHSRPEQQRRPTHPETRTPELSPPLPPSLLRP